MNKIIKAIGNFFDPADETPEQVVANAVQQEIRQRQRNDLTQVMTTPGGRRVIHLILHDLAGIHNLGWAAESTQHTSFHAGARNLGLALFAQLQESCPKLVQVMDDEASAASTPSP